MVERQGQRGGRREGEREGDSETTIKRERGESDREGGM